RISFDIGDDVLLATVNRVVITEGLPIVIVGYDKHVNWDKDLFSEEGKIHVREQGKNGGEGLMEFDMFQKEIKRKGCRLYGKDLPCSKPWRDRLMSMILPPFLAYRGIEDLNKDFKDDGRKVSSVNLMAYIGGGGTCLNLGNHYASMSSLKNADFTVTILVQEVGELVILPPMAAHQVANRGGVARKLAWNRLTPQVLDYGIRTLSPLYRTICEPEQYKFKNCVQAALKDRTKLITKAGAGLIEWHFGHERFCAESRFRIIEMQSGPGTRLKPYRE
ncbi:hypothetical protein BGZ81_003283, partial [Podila clonocystis]